MRETVTISANPRCRAAVRRRGVRVLRRAGWGARLLSQGWDAYDVCMADSFILGFDSLDSNGGTEFYRAVDGIFNDTACVGFMRMQILVS
jgi:hypothetical protein